MVQNADELATFQSLHEIVFEGSPRIVSAVFSPDGSVVHVQMSGEVIDLASILMAYAPIVGGTMMLVAALVVIWRVLRVRSSPERAGAWLCRRCRYEVTPLVDERGVPREGAMCSECGRSLSARRVRKGRSARRRLAIPLAALALVGLVSLLGVLAKTGVIDVSQKGLIWPSAELAQWARDENKAWLIRRIVSTDRFVDLDFQSGKIRRERSFPSYTNMPPLLSEDGRVLYRANLSRVSRSFQFDLEALELASGRVRTVAALPINTAPGVVSGSHTLLGFREGGSEMLVVGRVDDTQLVLSVDLQSGEVSELVREPAIAKREAWTGVVDNVYDAKRLVTVSGFSEMFEKKEAVIRAYELGERVTQTATLTYDAGTGIQKQLVSIGAAPVLFPESQMLAIASGDVTRSVMGIDLETGDVTHLNAPIMSSGNIVTQIWDDIALSADGKWMVLAETGNKEPSLFLRDTAAKAWVARLRYPDDLVRPVSVFSRDGKRLASIGFQSKSNTGSGFVHELLLYDLSEIPTVKASQ